LGSGLVFLGALFSAPFKWIAFKSPTSTLCKVTAPIGLCFIPDPVAPVPGFVTIRFTLWGSCCGVGAVLDEFTLWILRLL